MWQIEGHEVRNALNTGDHHQCFAKIDLRFARCVTQRHEHLLAADLRGSRMTVSLLKQRLAMVT